MKNFQNTKQSLYFIVYIRTVKLIKRKYREKLLLIIKNGKNIPLYDRK